MNLNIGLTTRGTAFRLPLDLATQSTAILAKRGVGKTYTAAVIMEELLAAGQVPVVIDPTGAALVEYWRQRLGDSGKRAIFDCCVAAYPRALSYDEVSQATGIAVTGGTWRTYVGELRGLELLEGKGELKAAADLFL